MNPGRKDRDLKPRSLRTNFAWAFLGNGISAFCRWVLLVMLAKMADPGTVGLFALAQALSLPITRFLGLQVAIVQVTDARNEYDVPHYFAVKFLSAVLALAASTCVAFWKYAGHPVFPVILALSAGYGVFELEKVFLAVMQKNERMDRVAVSNTLQGLLTLALFGGLFLVSGQLFVAVLGLLAARLLVLCLNDYPTARRLLDGSPNPTGRLTQFRPDRRVVHLAWTALPLGLVGGLQTLYTSIPRLSLEKYHGKEAVGYFAAMSSLLVAGTIMVTALTHSVVPRLARYYVSSIRAYILLLAKMVGIALMLGGTGILLALVLGRWILTVMFRPDYAEYHSEFVWITVAGAGLFVFSFVNAGLNAARRFRAQILVAAVACMVVLVTARAWIPAHGVMGGAWALLACYLAGTAACAAVLAHSIYNQARVLKTTGGPILHGT